MSVARERERERNRGWTKLKCVREVSAVTLVRLVGVSDEEAKKEEGGVNHSLDTIVWQKLMISHSRRKCRCHPLSSDGCRPQKVTPPNEETAKVVRRNDIMESTIDLGGMRGRTSFIPK